ncbi:MAG: hypothetical protein KatS3mg077_2890 [Candidatus Binatia bacterium]|nr:MAG: hypothetical protein KatS3mg077_2890 [Candidatus Binatia bacterium]
MDWSKVKLDEGFRGERFARGQVRSDFEINVESGYSGLDDPDRYALLTHEGTHIWQRQQGRLNNFGGAMRHLWSWLTHFGDSIAIYRVDRGFRGSFWELNFEQQAAVVGDWVEFNLSPIPPAVGSETGLPPVMLERLYLEFRYGPRPF